MMTEDKDKPKDLTHEELDRMVAAKERIRHAFPRIVSVDGRKYKVRQISKGVRARIHTLELEAYALSGKQQDAMPIRKAKRIQRKLDRLHAKTAAYYILGNRAVWMPWLFSWTWRKLMMRPEEHTSTINNAALNDEEVGFSLANWENTKHQLALSMKPIGDGVRQTLERWRAAEAQALEDAMKKNPEESK